MLEMSSPVTLFWFEDPFNVSKFGLSDPAFGYRDLSFPESHLLEAWGIMHGEAIGDRTRREKIIIEYVERLTGISLLTTNE